MSKDRKQCETRINDMELENVAITWVISSHEGTSRANKQRLPAPPLSSSLVGLSLPQRCPKPECHLVLSEVIQFHMKYLVQSSDTVPTSYAASATDRSCSQEVRPPFTSYASSLGAPFSIAIAGMSTEKTLPLDSR